MYNNKEQEVILLIADISGYTKFMLSHETSIKHGQEIISNLIKTITKKASIPFEISKLEGDAVFMYVSKEGQKEDWDQIKKITHDRMYDFMSAFKEKLSQMSNSNKCKCGACKNIESLSLKLIIHCGKALLYKIDDFNELAGKDVIIVHRLLKNSVKSNEYILMSEAAYSQLKFQKADKFKKISHKYEGIGKVKTYVHNLKEENIFQKIKSLFYRRK